jgi:site-specific DNA-cytosine methylase
VRSLFGRGAGIIEGRPTAPGLFAGIAGIELGLHAAGPRTTFLCHVDEAAQRVLLDHFPASRSSVELTRF